MTELPPCPYCRSPVRVAHSYAGAGSYAVCCTDAKNCNARWPQDKRRYVAIDGYLGYRTLLCLKSS